ncbi:hypothetical protein BD779DRAFT_645946 [Infundibulicybe gibba]|nr:hypothetical protein BD779DRAFT_645946 [Infundibulicybe gibba]
MLFAHSPAANRSACAWKQQERLSKIDSLPAEYFTPLSLTEQKVSFGNANEYVVKLNDGSWYGNVNDPAIMESLASLISMRGWRVSSLGTERITSMPSPTGSCSTSTTI